MHRARPCAADHGEEHFSLDSVEYNGLPGQIVIPMLHHENSAVRRQRPAVTKMTFMFADFHPGFDNQFLAFPVRASTDRCAVEKTGPIIVSSEAAEDYPLFATIWLGHQYGFSEICL